MMCMCNHPVVLKYGVCCRSAWGKMLAERDPEISAELRRHEEMVAEYRQKIAAFQRKGQSP